MPKLYDLAIVSVSTAKADCIGSKHTVMCKRQPRPSAREPRVRR